MSTETPSETIVYPILPLKNTVVFPGLVVPLQVGRPASLAALEAVVEEGESKVMLTVGQRDPDEEQPGHDDLFEIGTIIALRRVERGEHGVQLLAQGLRRVRVQRAEAEGEFLAATTTPLASVQVPAGDEPDRLLENRELARQIALLYDENNGERLYKQLVGSIKDPLLQMYRIASLANIEMDQQQHVLESDSYEELLERMNTILRKERKATELRHEIASQTREDIEQQQRDALLRQQKRAIEQALGEDSPEAAEAAEIRRRLEEIELPDEVRAEAEREVKRMERMSQNAADFQVARTYLELLTELPWTASTEDRLDLPNALSVLEEDHFGLDDVKDRILEFLAVMQKNPEARAPILCFVGPPGVGKTSLGQSIARALGRQFERMSLGGLHDEAELRGHRRTYVGAMPGRVLQALRRAEVNNPLLMLDEIDKLGRDSRGDPSAALMEILDPAQNGEFRDNYLNLPFDLSKVFFICTANSLDSIPRPLLDRMEILQLSGYSDSEKLEIAKRYLVPRQRGEAGLTDEELQITDSALSGVTHSYTREAGVRELERVIGRLARKVTRAQLEGNPRGTVEAEDLPELLGPEKFFPERLRAAHQAGVATGLAWTEVGGDVLTIEVTPLAREEKTVLTGSLGNVMQESARAAQSYLYANRDLLGLSAEDLAEHGLHLHVPAGAVPKDGPSAGVTIASALASMYTGRPVRRDLAMTGEITLTGRVLPVGGIREKALAAHRAGIHQVLLPADNGHEIDKLPEHVRDQMTFNLVERMDQVLELALEPPGSEAATLAPPVNPRDPGVEQPVI